MYTPGVCKECNNEVDERFPIIKAGEDCRPLYCRDCATSNNLRQMPNLKRDLVTA